MINYSMRLLPQGLAHGCWPAVTCRRIKDCWQRGYCSDKQPCSKPATASKLVITGTPKPPAEHRSKRARWRQYIFFGSLLSALLWATYELGKPELNQYGDPLEDELSVLPLPQQYLLRMWRSLQYYHKLLRGPLPTMLLPQMLHPPYVQPHYTLVLELKDVLVHPDWSYQTGWRFKKRPGVDYFLYQCSRHFEIVVYTAEQGTTVFPVLDALDPNGYIRYRLVRGATQFFNGRQIKNLQHLNRNLKRVIVIDWDRSATPLQQENVFGVMRWAGNDDDVQLFDLVAFLLIIAEHEVDDVREVLHYYRQFEDPIEHFKENQRKLLEQTQEKPDIEIKTKSIYKQWCSKLWNSNTAQR